MTTEELARRFAERCGWNIDDGRDGWVASRSRDDHPMMAILSTDFHGWPGVGIVVDEMARRGWAYMLRTWSERHHVAGFTKKNWPTEDDFLGTYEQRNGAVGDTPLDAVLAAAIAALEAEAKP